MPIYKNLKRNSGVLAYEILEDSIILTFKDGNSYLYSEKIPGPHHVQKLKEFAELGYGLNTYLNKNVRGNFEKKIN